MISLAMTKLASERRAISAPPASPGSSVDLAHDRVDRGDDGDGIGHEAAPHHVRQGLDVHEAGGADVETVGLRRTVGDHVAAELAAGALDGDVHLALGDLEPLR